MKQSRGFGFLIAAVAFVTSITASAYDDDYLTITGDESVRTNWVGERVVYIFTNTASAATATFKQNMTLQEVLIVGGGGAGGGFKGGGGGGGGVISDATAAFCAEGATFSVTVGKGGIATSAGGGSAGRVAAKPQSTTGAGYGEPSSFTFQGNTRTAFGGGGGGSDNGTVTGSPSKMTAAVSIGCGGGAGAKMTGNQTSEYYTDGQGFCGGTGAAGTGGGGGALTPGQNATTLLSGNGGEGVTNSITGVAEVYGSGGGGGGGIGIGSGTCDPGVGGTHAGDGLKGNEPAKAGSGDDGFGAGGGGGGYDSTPQKSSDGGDGGSGIVVLAFTVGGQASKPEFDADDIHVAYPNKETQPFVSVLLGGEAGYSATVSVLVGTGDDFTSTNVFYAMKSGDQPGEFAFIYPSPGETFKIKVIASADGVDDTVVTKEVTVPTDQGLVVPSHVGKGGGAGIIHVRVGAHGRNNGSCWTDAYTDFRAAIKLLAAETNELWYAGDEAVGTSAETISPAADVTIRGGFAGSENTPAERAKAAKSQLDGQDRYDCLTFNNAKGVVVDGFFFTKGKMHGLVKTAGAGDIVVTNCSFDANGLTQTFEGRAISVSDKTHVATAMIADCRISNHRDCAVDGKAGAVYVNGLSAATLSDCLFTSNGLAFGTSPFGAHDGRSGCWGTALAVDATPVTVERCDFRANVALSGNVLEKDVGGLVNLRGNCGESVFRNCAWVGNEVLYTRAGQDSGRDFEGGVLVVDVTGVSTVAVENCTFAGNLYEGHFATAGLNVRAGTANVKDSIFFANFSGNTCGDISPADLRVQAGATAHVTYTMFGGETNRLADAGGTLDIGVGCVDDDPLFATTAEVYASCRTLTGGHYYYTAASAPTLIAADIHEPEDSPALDTGDPQSPYKNEPKPNGHRVNMGRYGNTSEAAKSKAMGLTLIIR